MGSSLAWQTDAQLHDSVQRQLEWDPEIDAKDLAVIFFRSGALCSAPRHV